MPKYRNLITKQYKGIAKITDKLTEAYEGGWGLPCDLFFPIHAPVVGNSYQSVNIFEPEELPDYPEEPNVKNIYFYIPFLMKKESMNSMADIFDNFDLLTQGKAQRPFIETTPARELPIATKVLIHIGSSELYYFVDQKTVVNGAGKQLLLRQHLSPLTKDGRLIHKNGDI